MTPKQEEILKVLQKQSGLKCVEIMRKVGTTNNRTTRKNLEKLIELGKVEKLPDPDSVHILYSAIQD